MILLPWFVAAMVCFCPDTPTLVRSMAVAEGIDPDYAACIVAKESGWDLEAIGDFDENGDPQAIGPWQFWLPSWEQVSREMGLPETDLRTDAYESTRRALWGLKRYPGWWSAERRCRDGR